MESLTFAVFCGAWMWVVGLEVVAVQVVVVFGEVIFGELKVNFAVLCFKRECVSAKVIVMEHLYSRKGLCLVTSIRQSVLRQLAILPQNPDQCQVHTPLD